MKSRGLIMFYYGIRNKISKIPLGFTCSTACDDPESTFFGDISFRLEEPYKDSTNLPDQIWLVKLQQTAQRVLETESYYYTSDYDYPRWEGTKQRHMKDFEVFEVTF
jgi:hypothetical protein